MPGYSGTPLPKKLGIKAGFRVHLANAPAEVRAELREALAECEMKPGDDAGFCHAVHQVSRGIGQGVLADSEAAGAGRDVVGELAEEEFWRGFGPG